MTAAITFLSAAESVAFAAVACSAERNNTTMLPFCADVLAVLRSEQVGATKVTSYTDIAGWERVEVYGSYAGGDWRVVLSTPPAPQAARYR
jgi:hypothetical protein